MITFWPLVLAALEVTEMVEGTLLMVKVMGPALLEL
jgi:hypothetical protein